MKLVQDPFFMAAQAVPKEGAKAAKAVLADDRPEIFEGDDFHKRRIRKNPDFPNDLSHEVS